MHAGFLLVAHRQFSELQLSMQDLCDILECGIKFTSDPKTPAFYQRFIKIAFAKTPQEEKRDIARFAYKLTTAVYTLIHEYLIMEPVAEYAEIQKEFEDNYPVIMALAKKFKDSLDDHDAGLPPTILTGPIKRSAPPLEPLPILQPPRDCDQGQQSPYKSVRFTY
jgi:hypothetical protein